MSAGQVDGPTAKPLLARVIRICNQSLQGATRAADASAGIIAMHGHCPAAELALLAAEERLRQTMQCLRLAKQLAATNAAAVDMHMNPIGGRSSSSDAAPLGAASRTAPADAAADQAPYAATPGVRSAGIPRQVQQQGTAMLNVAPEAHSTVMPAAGPAATVRAGDAAATNGTRGRLLGVDLTVEADSEGEVTSRFTPPPRDNSSTGTT